MMLVSDLGRHSIAAVLILGSAASASAQDTPTPPPSTCYTVVEGRPDVPPGAPLLVDLCSGDTFVLRRSHGHPPTFTWIALTKETASAKASALTPSARPASAAQLRCFSYNGRSYCP